MSFRRPADYGRPDPMPAAEQLEQVRAQVEGLTTAELQAARWRIHPRDLEELRGAGVDPALALGLLVVVIADPDLEGRGPRLVWDDV